MNRSLNIIVADDERDTRQYLQELLVRLGHQVVTAQSGSQLVEQCALLKPDLILTDIKMPDLDGIQATGEINRSREVPVILISAHHDAELIGRAAVDSVMGYLIKPVKSADVEAAIAVAMKRFEQYQAVRKEARDLRQSLEDRKVTERAKGVVQKRVGVDEQEAFRRLRKLASDQNRKVVEISQTIMAADEVFQALERI